MNKNEYSLELSSAERFKEILKEAKENEKNILKDNKIDDRYND